MTEDPEGLQSVDLRVSRDHLVFLVRLVNLDMVGMGAMGREAPLESRDSLVYLDHLDRLGLMDTVIHQLAIFKPVLPSRAWT